MTSEEWFEAIQSADTNRVRQFLAAGFPVNTRWRGNDLRPTALQIATSLGHVEIMDVLFKAGASLESNHGTLLDAAIAGGEVQAVKRVIAQGVSLKPDRNRVTPLMRAIACKKESVAKVLLRHDKTPNAPDCFGHTPLHMAAKAGMVELCGLLLKTGCDPTACDGEGRTPLVLAAGMGQTELVSILLQREVGQEELDRALANAASTGRFEACRTLLKAGATLNWKDSFGCTPLMYSVDRPELLSLFLRSGLVRPKSRQVIQARATARAGRYDNATAMLDDFDKGKVSVVRPKAPKQRPVQEELLPFASEIGGTASQQKGFVRIKLNQRNARVLVERHQPRLQRAGYCLWHGLDDDQLLVFPTPDPIKALKLVGTIGEDLENKDIIAWFTSLAKEHPFMLAGAGSTWIEGRFLLPVSNPQSLADRILAFAPGAVSGKSTSRTSMIRELQRTGRFTIAWDI